jgi:hypothetical protein
VPSAGAVPAAKKPGISGATNTADALRQHLTNAGVAMRETYTRPRAGATAGVPDHLHPIVRAIAKRLRLKPDWPAVLTSGLAFRDRAGGEYRVAFDDAGWHVCLGWLGDADTAAAFRRAIEATGGFCDCCGDLMEQAIPEGWRCRHCQRNLGDGGLDEAQR